MRVKAVKVSVFGNGTLVDQCTLSLYPYMDEGPLCKFERRSGRKGGTTAVKSARVQSRPVDFNVAEIFAADTTQDDFRVDELEIP